jgi:predicted N-acetyltransferase YhbS
MLNSSEAPYVQPLGNGLVMRTAAGAADVERVARLLGVVFGPDVPTMTRHLFLDHPNTSGRDLIFVEDERSSDVVSTLCVIPWTWCYGDVLLPVGEMGCVATLETHRRRGLVRAQVGFFKQRLRERGCLLSHIQGIPYYYRQFGYEYALPLDGDLRLGPHEGPATPAGEPFAFRDATLDDIPLLMGLYEQAARDVAISSVRTEAIWRYLLTCTTGGDTEAETLVIEEAGCPAGYMRLPRHHFGDELMINEVSRLSASAAQATLVQARTLAAERQAPGVRLNVAVNSTLMRVARQYTSRPYRSYAWQIHVPDMAGLLRTLAPVLERRLAGSALAGWTGDVRICLYRETIVLHVAAGRIASVESAGFTERGDINVPPLQFIPLVLGYRSLDELQHMYPDVSVRAPWRLMVETLFPKVDSIIYTIY